ncbi:hypothetical protein [Streptomyces yanii]|uniref:hypothetical protein n=1 Tax=Streptomyces yanii TaxID=78510 RepID=UPI0031E92DC5
MSRAADSLHPHPLIPAGDQWAHRCPVCHLPIQGGSAGVAAHRRTVHNPDDDPRTPISIRL